jgi:hypothetical protein
MNIQPRNERRCWPWPKTSAADPCQLSAKLFRRKSAFPSAIAFARSINEIAEYKQELGFSYGVKGLTKYGCKVVKPANLAHGVISFVEPVISE